MARSTRGSQQASSSSGATKANGPIQITASGLPASSEKTSIITSSDLPASHTSSSAPDANKHNLGMSLATRQANAADENVFLFVPNLIGYARIILAALSLIYMKSNPKTCTLLYGVSCLLDAADGVAARRLGQSTKFGAVLDMVTDRCTTSCLLCFLTTAYPRCAILFQALITLDFSSHYIHMYSSLVTGSTSHKVVNEDVSKLLRHYYSQRWLFFYCAGNELFFVCLYLLDFYPTPLGLEPSWFLAPLPSSLQLHLTRLAVDQPKGAVGLAFALVRRTTWPQIAALVTLPICAAKQLFNALQFWKAAKVLVGIDLIERAKKREKQEE